MTETISFQLETYQLKITRDENNDVLVLDSLKGNGEAQRMTFSRKEFSQLGGAIQFLDACLGTGKISI